MLIVANFKWSYDKQSRITLRVPRFALQKKNKQEVVFAMEEKSILIIG